MPQARIGELGELGELVLEYQQTGDPGAPPIVLIMGTAAPLTMWDDDFCSALADRGHRVIRFDYRDTGRSSHIDAPMPSSISEMMAAFMAGRLRPPYRLEDLADDVIGLLDALAIERAHLLGLSQGGGVAQLVALRAPDRVTGLTLVATSTASPDVPPPDPETMSVLMTELPHDRDSFIDWNVLMYTRTGSTNPPPDVDWIRRRAERTWQHGWDRAGFLRHLLAVISASNRKPMLDRLFVPVSIVHGESDPIFPIQTAHQLAAAIPHARLRTVPGMGHDLPPVFWRLIVEEIAPARL